MPGSLRNVIVFTALAVAAIVTWFLSRPSPEESFDDEDTQAAPIGYYLKNAVLVGTNEAGQIYYRVFAGRLEQASRGDDLVLSRVRVEYDESEDVHWSLSAERGVAPEDRAYLDLLDGVRLATLPGSGTPTVIETDRLRLESENYFASSMESVSVSRGNIQLTGTGLSADLKKDSIELHSNVKGFVSP